jgi:formate dehydrogenase assembly factor FdhD
LTGALLCSPDDMEARAVGFIASSGSIRKKEEIRKLEIDWKINNNTYAGR